MPNFSLDRKLFFGRDTVAAAAKVWPNTIGFGDYGEIAGKPIGIYPTVPVTGTITVIIQAGDVEGTTPAVQTSRAYTAAEINSGNVKVYVPTLVETNKYLKVSITGATAAGELDIYLESYAGK